MMEECRDDQIKRGGEGSERDLGADGVWGRTSECENENDEDRKEMKVEEKEKKKPQLM